MNLLFDTIVILLPSITFWLVAGGLHAAGANDHYYKTSSPIKPTTWQLVKTQWIVDTIQGGSAFIHYSMDLYDSKDPMRLRPYTIFIGVAVIDIVQYAYHYAGHHVKIFKLIHKKHHMLVPVNTLGAYYDSVGEMLFIGTTLGVVLVGFFDLSVLEMAICSSIGTFATVVDHWGDEKDPERPLTRHELHHFYPQADFGQPFSGLWDWVFSTRHQDVYGKTLANK